MRSAAPAWSGSEIRVFFRFDARSEFLSNALCRWSGYYDRAIGVHRDHVLTVLSMIDVARNESHPLLDAMQGFPGSVGKSTNCENFLKQVSGDAVSSLSFFLPPQFVSFLHFLQYLQFHHIPVKRFDHTAFVTGEEKTLSRLRAVQKHKDTGHFFKCVPELYFHDGAQSRTDTWTNTLWPWLTLVPTSSGLRSNPQHLVPMHQHLDCPVLVGAMCCVVFTLSPSTKLRNCTLRCPTAPSAAGQSRCMTGCLRTPSARWYPRKRKWSSCLLISDGRCVVGTTILVIPGLLILTRI